MSTSKIRQMIGVCLFGLAALTAPSACGISGDNDAQEGSSTPVNEADEATAQAAMLTLADFEPGWRAEPPSDDYDGPSIECGSPMEGTTGSAESETFSQGEVEVSNLVAVYADEDAAAAAFDLYAASETETCLREEFERLIKDLASEEPDLRDAETSLQFGRVSATPIGDESLVYQAEITVAFFDIFIDAEAARVGRGVTLVTSLSMSSPMDGEMRSDLTSRSADRLRESLAD